MIEKKVYTSIHKGTIKIMNNRDYKTVGLVNDKNGFIIDLIDRIAEGKMNFPRGDNFYLFLFISEKSTPFTEVEGKWHEKLKCHYMKVEKTTSDVQYYEDWTETKHNTDFRIGELDLLKKFNELEGKWVYVKFEITENQ